MDIVVVYRYFRFISFYSIAKTKLYNHWMVYFYPMRHIPYDKGVSKEDSQSQMTYYDIFKASR